MQKVIFGKTIVSLNLSFRAELVIFVRAVMSLRARHQDLDRFLQKVHIFINI